MPLPRAARGSLDLLIDLLYGIKTRKPRTAAELGTDANVSYPYHPTSWRALGRVLKSVGAGRGDTFLNLGCGSGRALLIASRFAFDRIIGVEVSDELCRVALENVRRFGKHATLKCPRIEIVNQDAAAYAVPDDVSVVFLYCPFYGTTLDSALEQLSRSVARAPREVVVIYQLPIYAEKISRLEGLRIEEVPLAKTRDAGNFKVFRVSPAASRLHLI